MTVHPDSTPQPAPRGAPASTRLIPVTKWPEHHPWPTIPALRWMIFNAHRIGFSTVVKRVGRRVLIDEAAFFRWVEGQSAGGGTPEC